MFDGVICLRVSLHQVGEFGVLVLKVRYIIGSSMNGKA
jgi:hypothetical protein